MNGSGLKKAIYLSNVSLWPASDSLVCCNSIYRTSKQLLDHLPERGSRELLSWNTFRGVNKQLFVWEKVEKQYTDIFQDRRTFPGSIVWEKGGKMHNSRKSIRVSLELYYGQPACLEACQLWTDWCGTRSGAGLTQLFINLKFWTEQPLQNSVWWFCAWIDSKSSL